MCDALKREMGWDDTEFDVEWNSAVVGQKEGFVYRWTHGGNISFQNDVRLTTHDRLYSAWEGQRVDKSECVYSRVIVSRINY